VAEGRLPIFLGGDGGGTGHLLLFMVSYSPKYLKLKYLRVGDLIWLILDMI